MEKALTGQVVAVFGATGRVGVRVCEVLAEQGAYVAIHCNRSVQRAEEVRRRIQDRGGKAMVVQGDVTQAPQAEACVSRVLEETGRLDGVVDLIHRDKEFDPKPVADMEWQDWEPHIEAVKAYFHIAKAVIPQMRKQRYGRIVYFSGGLAFRFLEGCAPFSMVKAGLNAFSKSLALEEGRNNITVNVIAPGKIVTEQRNAGDKWEDLEAEQLSRNPLRRFAQLDDIANGVLLFLLPESGYITGQTLYLAGGEIMPMP